MYFKFDRYLFVFLIYFVSVKYVHIPTKLNMYFKILIKSFKKKICSFFITNIFNTYFDNTNLLNTFRIF